MWFDDVNNCIALQVIFHVAVENLIEQVEREKIPFAVLEEVAMTQFLGFMIMVCMSNKWEREGRKYYQKMNGLKMKGWRLD